MLPMKLYLVCVLQVKCGAECTLTITVSTQAYTRVKHCSVIFLTALSFFWSSELKFPRALMKELKCGAILMVIQLLWYLGGPSFSFSIQLWYSYLCYTAYVNIYRQLFHCSVVLIYVVIAVAHFTMPHHVQSLSHLQCTPKTRELQGAPSFLLSVKQTVQLA